jgi:iron complex outermembrane receptor protein
VSISVRNAAIQRAVRRVLIASAALAAVSAHAQDKPIQLEEVVVTGSRIQRPDFVSNSPVASVTAATFQDTGSTAIETVLNQLPQFVPSVTTSSNNPANGGQANIDLRGLGTNRNLVLLNGRRLPPSNSNGTVDVNIIPASLIERVEVVTGGASAVYGSDAIAGVTNFVLKKNFNGVAIDSGFSQTDRSDAEEWSSSLTLGSNFADDRGNAVMSIQYSNRDGVLQGDRDFSRVGLDVRQQGSTPLGSGTILEGRYDRDPDNSHTQAAIDQVFARYGFAPGTVARGQNVGFNADGTLFTTGTGQPNSVANFRGDKNDPGFNPDSFSYNFSPPNLVQLPQERWNFALFGDFGVSENVSAYSQVFYTTYNTRSQIAATPATSLVIPTTNPFITQDLATLLASRADPNADFTFRQRMDGVGPRQTDDEYNVHQFLVGLKGSVGDSYHWDVYAATSQMQDDTFLNNDVSVTRMQELLGAADGGVSKCAGGWNPFKGPAGLSPACADYVRAFFTNRTRVQESLAEATFGGKAFSMPAGDAQFSIGSGWREESFDFDPDLAVANGDLAGFNQTPPVHGDYDVKELFAELYLPLITDAKFAKSVDFTLGARMSDYSTSGGANSFKVEGDWQVSDSFRFRGSYQQAVRAPSIGELFSPPSQNFPPLLEDPCDNNSALRNLGARADVAHGGNGAIRSLCIQQGIKPADIDTYSFGGAQIETFGGGNPNLKEETANTFTFGIVFDSPFEGVFSNLKTSIDYYNIKLDDAIFSIPAGEILLLCYGFQGNNPTLDPNDPSCKAANRITDSAGRPSDGTPFIPSQGTANVSQLTTSGIDVQVDWGLDFGNAGRVNLNLLATWLDKWEIQYLPNLSKIDYSGTIGDAISSAFPDYKLFLNANWQRGPIAVGARVRFLPSMDNKYASYDPFTTVGTPSVTYLDGNVSYEFAKGMSVLVGVENATDKQPPLYTAPVQMNTDPSTFDFLGRRYFARANFKF